MLPAAPLAAEDSTTIDNDPSPGLSPRSPVKAVEDSTTVDNDTLPGLSSRSSRVNAVDNSAGLKDDSTTKEAERSPRVKSVNNSTGLKDDSTKGGKSTSADSPGSHYCSSTPPPNYKNGGFNEYLKSIWDAWLVFLAFAMTVPTLNGMPAIWVPPSMPWYAPDQASLVLVVLILNFMPTALFSVFGTQHPAEALLGDGSGELVSATWQLLHLALGLHYWRCIKLNIIPFVYPYGGKPWDVYSKANFARIMLAYSKFMLFVFAIPGISILCCSKAVLQRVKRYIFGTNTSAKIGGKLFNKYFSENPGKFFSVTLTDATKLLDLVPNQCNVAGHPEAILTKFNSLHALLCAAFDNIMSQALVVLTGDSSFECTVGKSIVMSLPGNANYEYALRVAKEKAVRMVEASRLARQKRRTLKFGSKVVEHTPKTSLLAECTSCEDNFSRYTDEMISKENAGIDTDNQEGQVVDIFTDKACTTKVFSTVKGKDKAGQIIDFLKKDYTQEPASPASIIYPGERTVSQRVRDLSISEPQAIDVRVADTNRYASQAYRNGDTVATYYAKIRPVLDWYIVLPLCPKCCCQMYPTNESEMVRCVTHAALKDRKKRGII